ncbi:MAG: BlaI/MecI/CopY family transcriptional regulator [Bryobacteraceae bacterium]
MPRKKSPQLTEGELRLMNVLWEKGSATVGEVVEALKQDPPPAYSTVLTTLRILEKKGYLRHNKEGRAFIYETVVDRQQASRGAIHHLLSRFFDNSPELLVANLLRDERMNRREINRLKKLITEHE